MPAELDYREDGIAAVLTVGETAWHREGTNVPPDHPAARDMGLALDLSGLDFEVEKVPHFVEIPVEVEVTDGAGRFFRTLRRTRTEIKKVESEDAWSVVRKDRDTIIGTVGSVWQPLQNTDAFAPITPALEQGIATIESGGVLRGGKQVWMLVAFDAEEIIRRVSDSGDYDADQIALVESLAEEIAPYGLMTNDHSGKAKARVKKTWIRVVCANTFDAATGREDEGFDIAVSHTANVEESYRIATEALFKHVATEYANLATYRETFRATRLDRLAYQRLVLDPAVPIIHLERKIQRREDTPQTKAALARASAKRGEIKRLWYEGDDHVGDESAWEAFNGLVQWVDHSEDTARDGGRVTSLMTGSLGKIKRRAFSGLLSYSSAPEDERADLIAARK